MNIANLEQYKRIFNKNYILETPRKVRIPDRIVTSYKKNGFYNYRMHKLNGEILGEMQAIPERVDIPDFYPETKPYYSFYIKKLESYVRNCGVGKSFMKIAQKESYKTCCDGKVHLIARNTTNAKDKPDIFYRKCGFDSQNKAHIEIIDAAINIICSLFSECKIYFTASFDIVIKKPKKAISANIPLSTAVSR